MMQLRRLLIFSIESKLLMCVIGEVMFEQYCEVEQVSSVKMLTKKWRSTVLSSYNCTHACDFLHGTTCFYSVSEVQIHGSQPLVGYKYDHA